MVAKQVVDEGGVDWEMEWWSWQMQAFKDGKDKQKVPTL